MIGWLLLAQLVGAPPSRTVVLFSGKWCGACAAMEPVWKQFVTDSPGLRCVYVDVDQTETEVYQHYAPYWESDRQMPQLIWLDANEKVALRRPGFVRLEELKRLSR